MGAKTENNPVMIRPELDLNYIWNAAARGEKRKMQNVAAYIRVSTDLADQENSYETQERYFYTTITKNPEWNLVGVYSDYGISGTSSEKRTGFLRLIRHCREGKIDRILCKSISRFARNAADFALTIRLLHEYHVSVFFERENLDTADPKNEFILNILGAFAQEESRSISCNTMMGNRMRNRRGDVRNVEMYGYRFNGKTVVCKSGYKYKEVKAVAEEARIVKRIFLETANEKSYSEIARGLNRDAIPAPDSAYGRVRRENPRKGQLFSGLEEGWTGEDVSRIVHSERYAGDVRVQKRYTVSYLTHKQRENKGELPQYYVKDHHDPIIDRALYESVRQVLEKRPKNQKRRLCQEYPFSGRLICGACGRFYHVRNYRNKKTWFCPTAKRRNDAGTCMAESMEHEYAAALVCRAVWKEAAAGHAVKCKDNAGMLNEAGENSFLREMVHRLEYVQEHDHVEQIRSIYKSRLAVLEEKRKNGGTELKKEKLQTELDSLERYWEELERDFGRRTEALVWMRSLPKGKSGMISFLDGIVGSHFKAFILDIVIRKDNCTVRWFDNVCTEIPRQDMKECTYGC